ncbi:unnamed protein product [Lactuca virosa]|uniref:DNA-directed RNA polymerase I subunit RPA12 n=1 Tax=Lactuca virosa TaxID=75947 RepID=A0AAU9NB17_9ASTR|nr:unnamed protein product [Lactuca virosa]
MLRPEIRFSLRGYSGRIRSTNTSIVPPYRSLGAAASAGFLSGIMGTHIDSIHQSDFMFCEICGTMLSFDSRKYVRCPLCNFKKKTIEVAGKEIKYTVSEEQIRRELGLSSIEVSGERTRSMDYNVRCPKCSNKGVYYHTQQTRSADEGQTMFYNCPNCGYNFTDNT